MFQRVTIVATTGQYGNPQRCFEYEMASYPTSLFDASLLPRKASKPVLADAILALTKDAQPTTLPTSGNVHFVLDGGALLHCVVWRRRLTYDEICLLYIQYVQRRYPSSTIVFDGYSDGPSTKDCTHLRRGHTGPAVLFESDMIATLKKRIFCPIQKTNKTSSDCYLRSLRVLVTLFFRLPVMRM